MTTLLAAADKVLGPLLWTKLDSMLLDRAPEELRALTGKGVTIDPPDEPDGSLGDFDMHTAEAERTRAHIDVKVVLQEALALQGLTIVEETQDKNFLKLTGESIPVGCECHFLMDNQIPPYAIRALSKSPVCIVLHVNSSLTADYNSFAHAIGVHVLRLKDSELLDSEELQAELKLLVELQTVTQNSEIDLRDGITVLTENAKIAEPAQIIKYAANAQEDLFEGATARILNPLTDGLIVLGGRFRGKPVPDGLIVEGYRSRKPAIALYDCKSKEENLYKLEAGDADQQRRYLEMLNSLVERHEWEAHGVVLFTPDVSEDQFHRKILKSPWTAFSGAQGRMVVVQAKWLLKWHYLTQAETPHSFRLLFSSLHFWEAVTGQKLQGLSDHQQSVLLGDRAPKIRLMSEAECELCWLSGLASAGSKPKIGELADVIAETDPGNINAASLTRAGIVAKFHKALDARKASIDSIATAISMTQSAVKYLVLCKTFHPDGLELPDRAYSNFRALHNELKSQFAN